MSYPAPAVPHAVIDPLCHQVAARLLSRHGWRLVGADALARQAAARLPTHTIVDAEMAERACLQEYAVALHAACLDPRRQNQAYRELHAYLYRAACHRRPDLAEDAAQEAIELVYGRITACREPRAFLKFASYQLLTAIRRVAPRHQEPSLDTLAPEGEELADPAGTTVTATPMADQAAAEADARALLDWLGGVLAAHPRARNQLLAVTLKYLDGLGDDEIAARLQTTVANVHVLRSRGLDRLRAEYGRWTATVLCHG